MVSQYPTVKDMSNNVAMPDFTFNLIISVRCSVSYVTHEFATITPQHNHLFINTLHHIQTNTFDDISSIYDSRTENNSH